MPDVTAIAIVLCALLLDAWWGEPRRWHPLVGFGNVANALEKYLNRFSHLAKKLPFDSTKMKLSASDALLTRSMGAIAWCMAVLPFVLLAMCLPNATSETSEKWRWLLDSVILYWAIGRHSLRWHAQQINSALENQDLALAQQRMSWIVSRDTSAMSEADIARGTVESVLENGNDAIFGAIFWFLVAGAPGVVLFRLANTLDAMWGYRNARFNYFGWAAARIDDLLNWLPARATALAYSIAGNFRSGMLAWQHDAPKWDSPNAGPVMAAGAGSLQLKLGGPASYDGEVHERPWIGAGENTRKGDIVRALNLVDRALLVWLLFVSISLIWQN